MAVIPISPVVTIEPVAIAVDVSEAVEIPGWDGQEPLYPCHFCGSIGYCDHLMRVLHLPDKHGTVHPIPVRAELGREWGRRRLVRLVGGLAQVYLQSRTSGASEG